MTRALVTLGMLAAIAAAITAAPQPSRPDAPATPRPPAIPPPAPATTPAPTRLDRAGLDRQDRVSARQRRRESVAYDDRPLLAELPLELAGVTIDLAGLARDEHTALLRIDPGAASRAAARGVYRRALATYGDTGRSYRLGWAP